MKSIHVASAAIALTGATLGAVALLLGAPDRLLGQSYDRALAAASNTSSKALVAAAHAPGSEHFWLTRSAADAAHAVSLASMTGDGIAAADIKQAIAAAGALDAGLVDLIDVQDVARAALNGQPTPDRALLVTAKIRGSGRALDRTVRVVVDVGSPTPAKAASAL